MRPGGRVAILAKNCAAYVELLYACWTLGAAAIPINARLHAKEVAFILDDAESQVCFITDDADTSGIEAARAGGSTCFIDVDGPEYAALLKEELLATPPASGAHRRGLALLHERNDRPPERASS